MSCPVVSTSYSNKQFVNILNYYKSKKNGSSQDRLANFKIYSPFSEKITDREEKRKRQWPLQ